MFVAIIEARMTSRRLPGKCLMQIGELTLLGHIIKRLSCLSNVVPIIATPYGIEQFPLHREAGLLGAYSFMPGKEVPENDVLTRVAQCSSMHPSHGVLRLTGDNPFIDPSLIGSALNTFSNGGFDYLGVLPEHGCPLGLSFEVINPQVLKFISGMQLSAYDREHVTTHIRDKDDFRKCSIQVLEMLVPEIRLTCDEQADLDFLRTVYKGLSHLGTFTARDIMYYVDKNRKLLDINKDVHQTSTRNIRNVH